MTREKLQEQYSRVLLQLESEARVVATSKPSSKLYRSSLATIKAAGDTLERLSAEWREVHRISATDSIIFELFEYAGFCPKT